MEGDLYSAASVLQLEVTVSQSQELGDGLTSAIFNVIELVVMGQRGIAGILTGFLVTVFWDCC